MTDQPPQSTAVEQKRGRLGGKPATGSVISQMTLRGEMFGIRFQAYGRRQYLSLGSADDGWTAERAFVRLDEILAEVKARTWAPPLTVDDLVRDVLAADPDVDPDTATRRVLDAMTPEHAWASVAETVTKRVGLRIAKRDGAPKKRAARAARPILSWPIEMPGGHTVEFGDLTSKDVADVLSFGRERARAMLEDIASLTRVRDAMDEAGAATVRDLGAAQVQEAWDGSLRTHRRLNPPRATAA